MRAMVIGAGVGGLTAGLALRRAGIQTDVFEAAPEPRPLGAGLYLWSNALLALRRVGLDEAVATAGRPLERNTFFTSRGRIIADWPVGEMGRRVGAPTVGVRRSDLHHALYGAADQDLVRFGHRCVAFEQDSEGVVARFENGTEERGDVLIGADGIASTVRAQLLGAAAPRYAGYRGWRTVLDWEDEPLGRFCIYAGRGCRFVSYPVAPGKMYWLAMSRTRPGGIDEPDEVKGMLAQQFGDFTEPVPGLISAAPETAIVRGDMVDRDPVKTWGEGRVTMLGDAAHAMTPNQAMGACSAIEDGIVLTRHLSAAGADTAGALRAYERERMRRTARLTLQSRRVGAIGHWRNPVACAVRDALMTVVLRTVARRTMARDIDFAG